MIPPRCILFCLVYIISFASFCIASSDIAPIPVPVGTDWFGYDGQWSPVNIRVGSPPQWLSVLPCTGSQETWVVGRYGCDGSFECRKLRGGLFEPNVSTTWQELGYYELDMDIELGFTGYGQYGFDNIALDESLVSHHQAIGIVNSTQYWLGYLGLGINHINFTDDNELTYLSTLVENQSLIPSHSYGYTAGAYYRLKQVPSSLTLGGVDTNRFEPNNVSFSLAPERVPVVAINSITVRADPLSTSTTDPSWEDNPLELLGAGDAELFTIDSATPFLWLPEPVCDAFALAFGLTYNETLELYGFNGNTTAHDELVNWNMTFTFSIADLPQSTHSIDLTLPYDAFDLQLSYPFPGLWANDSSPPVDYFPLKRAANDSQYTIGRAFLQEVYLAVDYERNNFSLSQAKFALDSLTNQNIVAITRPENSTLAGPAISSSGSSGLSSGAIAGIAVAGAVVGVLVCIGGWCCLKRRKSKANGPGVNAEKTGEHSKGRRKGKILYKLLGGPPRVPPTEVPGDKYYPTEVPADAQHSRFELMGSGTPVELPGSEPGSTQGSGRGHAHSLSAYEQTARKLSGAPAELPHSNSIVKMDAGYYAPPSNSPNLPAYSPSQVGRPPSHPPRPVDESPEPSPGVSSISPTGPRDRDSCGSSQMTSPLFSPITPQTANRPNAPISTGLPSPYVSSNTDSTGGTGRESRGALAVMGQPMRSASRSSRFVEEGISTGSSSGNEDIFREAREAHQRQQIEAAERARRVQLQQLEEQEWHHQQQQPQQGQGQGQGQPETQNHLNEPRRFSWEE